MKTVRVAGVNYKTVEVSWSRVKGAKGYEIYASKNRIGKFHKVATVKKGNVLSAQITKCVTGKTYYFKVRAYQKSGGKTIASKYSAVKKITVLPAKAKVKLKPVGSTVWITWDACPDASKGYKIYRATKAKGKYTCIKTIKDKKTEMYIDTGLKGATTYYYKIVTLRGKFRNESKVKSTKTPRYDGNAAAYDVSRVTRNAESPLKGRDFIFLGSSVTLGKYSSNISFVEYLEARHGIVKSKYAVNGTTLVGQTGSGSSYVARLNKINRSGTDCLVCQLSTNDARKLSPLGSAVGGTNLAKFNTKTVAGAIEYITVYAQQKWDCPVVFYTVPAFSSTYANDAQYRRMIGVLYQVQKQHSEQMHILDLWGYDGNTTYKITYANADDRDRCMIDAVHPSKAGYRDKYLPAFEQYLTALLPQPEPPETPVPDPEDPDNADNPGDSDNPDDPGAGDGENTDETTYDNH